MSEICAYIIFQGNRLIRVDVKVHIMKSYLKGFVLNKWLRLNYIRQNKPFTQETNNVSVQHKNPLWIMFFSFVLNNMLGKRIHHKEQKVYKSKKYIKWIGVSYNMDGVYSYTSSNIMSLFPDNMHLTLYMHPQHETRLQKQQWIVSHQPCYPGLAGVSLYCGLCVNCCRAGQQML